MIKVKATLTDAEGQISDKMYKWSYLVNYYIHRHHTWYLGTKQKVTSNEISFLDLEIRSRSHLKIKGQRRRGVCDF